VFATIYHFVYYLTGLQLPFLKVVNTFGFFVALSIGAAYWAFKQEFDRKSKLGIFPTVPMESQQGKPMAKSEYAINGIMSFIFGYKILYLLVEASSNSQFSPPDHVFTSEGNWLLGLGLLGWSVWSTWRKDKEQRAMPRVEELVQMPAGALMGSVTMVALASGFLGAKLFHLVENWDWFLEGLKRDGLVGMMMTQGGWTFYGGLICGGAGVLLYARSQGLPWKSVLDAGGPGMMLSYGIGRFGCHFSGDGDWGIANLKPNPGLPDWAWAYKYPNNVLGRDAGPDMEYIPGSLDEYAYQLSVPVYPTPLYEALMAMGLFAVLWFWGRKQDWQPGRLFSVYMIFAGLERFIIELIREHGDSLYTLGTMVFSQAQMISLALVIGGAIGFVSLRPKHTKNNDQGGMNGSPEGDEKTGSGVSGMAKSTLVLLIISFIGVSTPLLAQEKVVLPEAPTVSKIGNGKNPPDTLVVEDFQRMDPILITTSMDEEKKQNYLTLKRRVKKTLPYAKMAALKMKAMEDKLNTITDKKAKKKYIKECEASLKELYMDQLKNLTIGEGQVLMKLLHRETGKTSWAIMRNYRGTGEALFWQAFGSIYGHDLKVEYDPIIDYQIENIIRVEHLE